MERKNVKRKWKVRNGRKERGKGIMNMAFFMIKFKNLLAFPVIHNRINYSTSLQFNLFQLITWSHWDGGLEVSGRMVGSRPGWIRLFGARSRMARAARPILFLSKGFKRKIGYFEVRIIKKDE